MISKIAYLTVGLLACAAAHAQVPASPAPTGTPPAPVVLTLADALERAKANSPQFQAAVTELGLAREDRYQARASLLPGVDYNNAFIYTQGNGTSTGRYVGANGVHEYISQGVAHENIRRCPGLGLPAHCRSARTGESTRGNRCSRTHRDGGAGVLRTAGSADPDGEC